MWTMGYNEAADFNSMAAASADPFTSRKLRPLIPKPSPTGNRIHDLSFNHNIEQSKRIDQQVITSSRWNPTAMQLQILEDLYRRGTRTPSTDHIQHITAQLRRYGKIEGKNVFYWFQNHKARERQKRRRQLESPPNTDEHYFNVDSDSGGGYGGGNDRTCVDYDHQIRNCPPPTKFTTTLSDQISGSAIQRGGLRRDGWIEYEAREMEDEHTRSLAERNGTWQAMDLSFSPIPPLINPTTAGPPPLPFITMDPHYKLNLTTEHQDLGIFIRPYRLSEDHQNRTISVTKFQEPRSTTRVHSPTLELFPLHSNQLVADENQKDYSTSVRHVNKANLLSTTTPSHFIEFLPLKD